MKVYVINLPRRLDRRMEVMNQLGELGVEYELVPALDASRLDQVPKDTQVSKVRYCIWQSHVAAMTAIAESDAEHGLILEDDVVLSTRINWKSWLQAAGDAMNAFKLDRLQVGYISAAYRKRFLMSKGLYVGRRFPNSELNLKILNRNYRVDLGSHRAGAHCYIMSRELSRQLPQFNDPVWAGPDAFFDRISSASFRQGRWRMGSLRMSLAEQRSRSSVHSEIDSDNE